MPKLSPSVQQARQPNGQRRETINTRVRSEVRRAMERAATESGRNLSGEVEHRLEQAWSHDRIIEDVRLMIREEIRAALTADRAAQAEASELLMRDTVETMRVGMAVAGRRARFQAEYDAHSAALDDLRPSWFPPRVTDPYGGAVVPDKALD